MGDNRAVDNVTKQSKERSMAYKRKAKKKEDLSKNPAQGVNTSMGRYYLEMGLVKIIDLEDARGKENTQMD